MDYPVNPNAARNAEIIRRRNAGEFPYQIAADMRLTRNTVIGVCGRAGVYRFDNITARAAGGHTKLSPETVKDIRSNRNCFARELAAKHGVSTVAICKIWSGESWGWLK